MLNYMLWNSDFFFIFNYVLMCIEVKHSLSQQWDLYETPLKEVHEKRLRSRCVEFVVSHLCMRRGFHWISVVGNGWRMQFVLYFNSKHNDFEHHLLLLLFCNQSLAFKRWFIAGFCVFVKWMWMMHRIRIIFISLHQLAKPYRGIEAFGPIKAREVLTLESVVIQVWTSSYQLCRNSLISEKNGPLLPTLLSTLRTLRPRIHESSSCCKYHTNVHSSTSRVLIENSSILCMHKKGSHQYSN